MLRPSPDKHWARVFDAGSTFIQRWPYNAHRSDPCRVKRKAEERVISDNLRKMGKTTCDKKRNNPICLPRAPPRASGPAVFSYKLRYIVGSGLVVMAITTNPRPTIYRNLYENTGQLAVVWTFQETLL